MKIRNFGIPHSQFRLFLKASIYRPALILVLAGLSLSALPQTETPGQYDQDTLILTPVQTRTGLMQPSAYFGLGFVTSFPGGGFGMEFTGLSRSLWGGSINYKTTIRKTSDMPSDYLDGTLFEIVPKDYFDIVSLCLVRKGGNQEGNVWFGIEAGPAFVREKYAVFELNPDFDPYSRISIFNKKWLVDHDLNSTFGLTISGTFEIFFSKMAGLKFYLSGNINDIEPQVNFGGAILFGYINR